MGFRLGEIRGARHRSFPCQRLNSGADRCEVSDSTFIVFQGDTLLAVGYLSPKFWQEQGMAWRQHALPWLRRHFGEPDSVRTESHPDESHPDGTWIRGYWQRRTLRGTLWNVKVTMFTNPEGSAVYNVLMSCYMDAAEQMQCP
jgi:hypothetical protein